jgi:hypothetical protein
MALVLAVTLVGTVVLSALAYVLGALLGRRGDQLRDWVRANLWLARPPTPEARPIEAIVADLRRLGGRFHTLDPRTSFIKAEAFRLAYDRTLAECCSALAITHLLGVLPAGPELDAERTRVEEQLAGCGVRLHAA